MMIPQNRKCFEEKNSKISKWEHTFKGYASSYNVEIWNSFNSELQLKETEPSIKNNLKKYSLN